MVRHGRPSRVLLFHFLLLLTGWPGLAVAQDVSGPLVVYNAGSLAVPFKQLLDAFVSRHPRVRPDQEHSGSLAAVRKLTELGRVPDVVALADESLFPALLAPDYLSWYAVFAQNAMVLAASPRVSAEQRATTETWPEVLLDGSIRWGRADPAVDPAGYRALMVFDLAERYYDHAGLATELLAHSNRRYLRPKSADLVALLQLGELDYAWLYASLARFHGLPFVGLPDAVNLSSPDFAELYGLASVTVPGRTGAQGDTIVVRGRPIEYGVSIPRASPHPQTAMAFYLFLASEEGRAILRETGLIVRGPPVVSGSPPPGLVP